MSDALAYLVKARPDALGPYFKFLKQCGRHLDPKTRNLISVITKVHAQTERGLRQYLTRALREGCTPAEVIDALLMAFPALGLAKIVWATDVILAMDLPGFSVEALQGEPGWHDLVALDAIGPGETRRVECDGRVVFVHRAEDGPRVYDARCPHQGSDLSHAELQGATLTCPKHEWAFDLGTGACIRKGEAPLTRHETRVAGGRLLARW